MKIQRSTFILVLLSLGLASGIYLQQRLTAVPESGEAGLVRPDGEALFGFQEADITQVTIQRPDLTLSLKKRDAPVPGEPDWTITAPEQGPASDGAVAYLLNLLATGDRRDSFRLTNDGQPQGDTQKRLSEFGLDQPMAQVEVTLVDGSRHQLILGDRNFDGSGLYGVADAEPSSAELTVFWVTSDFETAVQRPLADWRYSAELPDAVREESLGEDPPEPGAEPGAVDGLGNDGLGNDGLGNDGLGNGSDQGGGGAGVEAPESNLGDPAQSPPGELPSPEELPE